MNTLKLTNLNIGESVEGTILSAEEVQINGKDGKSFPSVTIVLRTADGDVKVQTAGNVKKFFKKDQATGKYDAGKYIVITRGEQVTLKNGFQTSHFFVEPGTATKAANPVTPVRAASPVSKKAELEAKLAAQRSGGR